MILAGGILLLHNLFPHCHEHVSTEAVHQKVELSAYQIEGIWHLLVLNDAQEGHLENFYPSSHNQQQSDEALPSQMVASPTLAWSQKSPVIRHVEARCISPDFAKLLASRAPPIA